jgi:hypothetical protein
MGQRVHVRLTKYRALQGRRFGTPVLVDNSRLVRVEAVPPSSAEANRNSRESIPSVRGSKVKPVPTNVLVSETRWNEISSVRTEFRKLGVPAVLRSELNLGGVEHTNVMDRDQLQACTGRAVVYVC